MDMYHNIVLLQLIFDKPGPYPKSKWDKKKRLVFYIRRPYI